MPSRAAGGEPFGRQILPDLAFGIRPDAVAVDPFLFRTVGQNVGGHFRCVPQPFLRNDLFIFPSAPIAPEPNSFS